MFQGSGGCSVPMVTFSLLILTHIHYARYTHRLLCIDVRMQIEHTQIQNVRRIPLSWEEKLGSVQFCVPV